MLMLAFETSGPTASVALLKEGRILAEQALHHTRTHSETVMPMAEHLLSLMEHEPKDLDAVAVNVGPGSFTGVRIGVASANAMAQALGIPVVGVNSLRVLYENACIYPGPVCAMLDARNESVYAAVFSEDGGEGVLYAGPVREYIEALPQRCLFLGDGALQYRDILMEVARDWRVAKASFALSRAGALGQAALELLGRTPALIEVRQVEPLYLRPSQAERMWEMKHGGHGG